MKIVDPGATEKRKAYARDNHFSVTLGDLMSTLPSHTAAELNLRFSKRAQ